MNDKTYSASAVANSFIQLAKDEGLEAGLTNMKLQKLVYIANGYCWAVLGRPLISDDIHAFEYGPVIPTLYNRLKRFGARDVSDLIETKDELHPNGLAFRLVKQVWDAYKKFDAIKLSSITHQPNTPWSNTWAIDKFGIIKPDVIKPYYEQLLNERTGIQAAIF